MGKSGCSVDGPFMTLLTLVDSALISTHRVKVAVGSRIIANASPATDEHDLTRM